MAAFFSGLLPCGTTIVAPTSGPASVPAPPTITTSTKRIDCRKAKVEGVTKPESGANSAPARPAQAAESAEGQPPDLLEQPRPRQVGENGDAEEQQRKHQQAPIDDGKHDQAADELDHRPPRVVDHAEDEVADGAGVFA